MIMSYKILNISKFSNSHSIFSSPSVISASHAASRSVYAPRIHAQPKRALPHYTPKAKYSLFIIHSRHQPFNLCRRQRFIYHLLSIIYAVSKIFINHYSLNFARPLRPLRPDNPDSLLSSFSGEYNSPLSSSRAQDFSFEVEFLGFSRQDIGIFEDHRLYQKSQKSQ